jgi:hypothetical protein
MDELVFPQAARLFRSDKNELVQLVFGSDYMNPATTVRNVLAHNIVGLYFVYDPGLRIMTMYIAAKGDEGENANAIPAAWPSDIAGELPGGLQSGTEVTLVNRVNWRVRN